MAPRPDESSETIFTAAKLQAQTPKNPRAEFDFDDVSIDKSSWDRFRQTSRDDWPRVHDIAWSILRWCVTVATSAGLFAGLILSVSLLQVIFLSICFLLNQQRVCWNDSTGATTCISFPQTLMKMVDFRNIPCNIGLSESEMSNANFDTSVHLSSSWSSCLLLFTILPHLISLVFHFRTISGKNKLKIPAARKLLFRLFIMDFIHVGFVSLLLFKILPQTNSLHAGVFYLAGMLMTNGISQLFKQLKNPLKHKNGLMDVVTCTLAFLLIYSSVQTDHNSTLWLLALFGITISTQLVRTKYFGGITLGHKVNFSKDFDNGSSQYQMEDTMRGLWKICLIILFFQVFVGQISSPFDMSKDSILVLLFAIGALSTVRLFNVILKRRGFGRETFIRSLLLAFLLTFVIIDMIPATPKSVDCPQENSIDMMLLLNSSEDSSDSKGSNLVVFIVMMSWVMRHLFRGNTSLQTNIRNVGSFCIGILPDLSLIPQRISYEQETPRHPFPQDEESGGRRKIWACVTMWHETEVEMTTLLKSLYRVDLNQMKRSSENTTFYDFEAHIFIDDGFESGSKISKYVSQFITCTSEAFSQMYDNSLKLRAPVKMITPYGLRLVWNLPGGTCLTAHVKDNQKIRNKKRWSQVMYMYYLLGYKMDHTSSQADNTYILALDGDVDFTAESLELLLENMGGNPDVAAACGRLHPTGSGPLVWYQKFEYAASHWIQKATEHVFSSVLCSPGAFSLYRASALMSDNVVRSYANMPTKPRHFLQYDQGEDRWLCTLLMQQGFRIEYNSLADAYTQCPETFDEFFNQRRRWNPASVINNVDMVFCWTSQTKSSVRTVYMWYLTLHLIWNLFGGSLFVGICIRGLYVASGGFISMSISAVVNMLVLGAFVFATLVFQPKTQVRLGRYITIFYACVQGAILLRLLSNVFHGELCSSELLYFLAAVGVQCMAAMFHPQEIKNIYHCITFFLFLPSFYLLVTWYSYANLFLTSWGTRDASTEEENVSASCNDPKTIGNCASHETFGFVQHAVNFLRSNRYNSQRNMCIQKEATFISKKTWHHNDFALHDILKTKYKNQGHKDLPEMVKQDVFGDGPILELERSEATFFHVLIHQYLKPLDGKETRKELDQQLKALRNQVLLGYSVLNILGIGCVYIFDYFTEDVTMTTLCGEVASLGKVESILTVMYIALSALHFSCMLRHRWLALKVYIKKQLTAYFSIRKYRI